AGFCSFVVTLAQAQDNTIERITTTASRTAASANNLLLTVSRVDQRSLALIAPTHIEEALKQVAGANLQRGNGQEYLPALRSQVFSGAGACGGILTAEDGIPLRAAGFCNVNELFEAHSEMAQRLEVLKGPGSVLYGSNAVHGVINVITPDTTYEHALLGLDLGSYGYQRYKLRAGQDYGQSGIGVNASLTSDSGYRANESVEQQKVNLRHRYSAQQFLLQSGVTFTNLQQDTAGYASDYSHRKQPAEAQQPAQAITPYRDAKALRLWSKASWDFTSGDIFTVTPYLRDQQMEFIKHFLPGSPLEQNSQQGIGLLSLWQHELNRHMQLQLGFDSEYSRGDMLEYQHLPATGSDFVVATVPVGKHYDYDVSARLYAPFIAMNWQHNNWLLHAGVRYEHMRYSYQNNMLSGRTKDDGTPCALGGCRFNRPPSSVQQFDNLSPKLALSYQLSRHSLLYANLSRGYRAPQTAELYQLQREQSVADLRPETANNLELGYRFSQSDLRYTLALYQMSKHNFIFRDSNFFNVNDGKSRHQGIELELDYAISDALSLAIAASHARHRYNYSEVLNGIDINGNDIDTAPRTLANIQLDWHPLNNLQLGLEWHYVSRYYTDAENLHQYGGHNLFNLRGRWQINPALTLYGRIQNLSNHTYAERADYSAFDGDRYFPGRPRNVSLSLVYRWE
ncbi:MAG TPA: TonB-dependent receptor, partial [Rheinheimera sp.]|nr:TonB-dependent receptor [Rheinheimera sp.]